ncbi:hypothetical protein [Haloarchaeobius sp. HME9146]|uniref:hypothetical protein n=1 Tax=unclassified Haloarchaeobius TaxID=2614452 RepID=UPI0021BE4087|nr:hypothetical protein [Haloarchaeobius sp. HME9146]MCT9095952.1 hypothetical protein [Haloarchaeobius sp. HME9146]
MALEQPDPPTGPDENPTFRVADDDAGHVVEYGPDDYVDYEYSDDGNWLVLTVETEDGLLAEKRFFIGYPA